MGQASQKRGEEASQLGFAFEERAAICEHVGKLSRRRAELVARHQVGADPPPAISDVTGGPLNAIEAHRVMAGESIRCVGVETEDGARACRACYDASEERGLPTVPALEGHGFRMFVWRSRPGRGDTRPCVACGSPVRGELGR